MFKNIRPISIYQWSKRSLVLILTLYACICTIVIIRMKPRTILIGIDSYGTRVIETTDDRLIRMERHNFVKKFIDTLYNYNETNFSQAISQAGDMMQRELWDKRQSEYLQILEEIKSKPLTQTATVEDLRELDANTYQADLKLVIKRNLVEKEIKLRVDFKLASSARTGSNPFPYEVISYDEQMQ